MDTSREDIVFERTKIYEQLEYQPQPAGYAGKLPWTVQQQIAATNGVQYLDRIGKLKDYPQYELPVDPKQGGIMLDIGTGWGRWLVAGAHKGYIPVGADIRLEFCKTALETLKAQGKTGYTVVADLKSLPFQDDIFDLVWSFSVIQHTHKDRMIACLEQIKKILKPGGLTKLEFPNKHGIHNYFGPVKKFAAVANDYHSWEVRYYTALEYKKIISSIFGNFRYSVHSFLGIGVLKEDLKYVSFKNKILCAVSLAGSGLAKLIRPLKSLCDSIYVEARKQQDDKGQLEVLELFLKAHRLSPGNNLNIIHLLKCPLTGSKLMLSGDGKYLQTSDGKIKYPVIDGIPVMIASEALQVS